MRIRLSPEPARAYRISGTKFWSSRGASDSPSPLAEVEDREATANKKAWAALLEFEKPFLIAFSDGDPITGGLKDVFFKVPGTRGQPHTTIEGAGHFLQEDMGEELARVVNDFVARNA